MKKQYTKQQIHDAMYRLLKVKFESRENILGTDCLVYSTEHENLKMVVDLKSGMFSGFEKDTQERVPPFGATWRIEGM